MSLSSKEQLKGVVFCSLGENCLGQGVLDRKGMTSVVSPFSWGRINIDYVLDVIREDFVDLLNPDYLEHRMVFQKPTAKNLKYQCESGVFIEPMASGFEFTHHDVIESEEARHSMQRKIERLKESLASPQYETVLVYHHRPVGPKSIPHVVSKTESLIDLLRERRGQNNISGLLIFQSMVTEDNDRKVSVSQNGKLIRAEFFTKQMWTGADTDVFWGRVDDDLFDQMFDILARTLVENPIHDDQVAI